MAHMRQRKAGEVAAGGFLTSAAGTFTRNSQCTVRMLLKGLQSLSRPATKPMWVVVKIMVPFWIAIIIRRLIFRVPKRDHNFDSHLCVYMKSCTVSVATPMQATSLSIC